MWPLTTTKPIKDIEYKDYRIGRLSTRLLRLVDLGVPPPSQALYYPYTISYVRADLARIGDGVATIEWTWDVLDLRELAPLLDIFFDATTDTYAHLRYIRSDYRTGDFAGPAQSFANFKCTVWRPQVFGQDGEPVVNTNQAYQSVRLKFTNLVVV